MSIYDFNHIEKKWQEMWTKNQAYRSTIDLSKPKCYVLDMFPYPSGAGLHVGHPLGYIASDIYARYKRLKGFNVLHPIGFDAFGLPAEQYAIEHGIHPAVSTKSNIENFRQQLSAIGFSFDWDREVITCDPSYYKWTQWIFLQFFGAYFNVQKQKAASIASLTKVFEKEGNLQHPFPNEKFTLPDGSRSFSATQWGAWGEEQQQVILMEYRLAYLAFTDVNWCEALGTVLANDEVINGLSYRGGHPVVKKKMRQWNLRISAYAERLLNGLDQIDFSPSLKEIQRNWIGKSIGAEIRFPVPHHNETITVFTTRPDTLFGVDFMVLAPEHPLVKTLTSPKQASEVNAYLQYVSQRSDIERMAETNRITGCFLDAYALHPITQKQIPIWTSEYVLAHYGTGSIMAVPAGDQRDFLFAQHFKLPITNIFGDVYNQTSAISDKHVPLKNSMFLDGLMGESAIKKAIAYVEEKGIGKRKVNYKMRDAGWSRQRYWGEPFPVVYKNDIPYPLNDDQLPLALPDLDHFISAATGEGPLANVTEWIHPNPSEKRDSNTMPTHAGAAWYFLRFTDPHNEHAFASKACLDYWNQVDLYVGGIEHAVAHLLYARLWTKVLFDLGFLSFDEPFKKLVNQGKIMGDTRFVYRVRGSSVFVSFDKKEAYETDPLRVDVNLVDGIKLDTEGFKKWRPDFASATFILNQDGDYLCGTATEKMSKSYYNVVNPSDLIEQYGADTLRMYELFLGPLEDSKPWDTQSIEGTHRFLKRLWRWLHHEDGSVYIDETPPTEQEQKILHRTIKKVEEDTEHFAFNTAISCFMTCLNDLQKEQCHKKSILEPLLIMLSPYVPHIAEELWQKLGNPQSILHATFPSHDPKLIEEKSIPYVICINGKKRAELTFDRNADNEYIEKTALKHAEIVKWINGATPKKVILVPQKMVNIVL